MYQFSTLSGTNRLCQADFFTRPQNSISFPRCCAGTHIVFLRNLLGM